MTEGEQHFPLLLPHNDIGVCWYNLSVNIFRSVFIRSAVFAVYSDSNRGSYSYILEILYLVLLLGIHHSHTIIA